jgi:hypothetical protein
MNSPSAPQLHAADRVVSEEQRLLESRSAEPRHVSAAVVREPPREQRDVRRAIALWQQHASADGHPPLLDNFRFSPMTGSWDYRFLICGDQTVGNSVFVGYGFKFARVLGLSDEPLLSIPLLQQLPERYRPLFAEGCIKAIAGQAAVRFSGSFEYEVKIELYRTAFMPIILQPNWSKQLVFGSFNFRTVDRIEQ